MEQKKIFLCCGAGMSSGFLAQQTRKAIKKNKVDVTVEARSESEVQQYINGIDIILLGPHYDFRKDSFKEMAEPHGVKVDVIPEEIYSTLDGQGLLEFALEALKG